MMQNHAYGRLSRISATAALVAALIALPTAAQVKSWNTGFGNWSVAGNWTPVGLPGITNQVFIGNTRAAENAFVQLNIDAVMSSLTITDGMVLESNTSQLIVAGLADVSGLNQEGDVIHPSRLRVEDGPELHDVIAGGLTISDEAWLEMQGGILAVSGTLTIDQTSLLYGVGMIKVAGDGAVAMAIHGSLQPGVGGLTLVQEGDGKIDLDGSTVGDVLNLTGAMFDGSDFETLQIQGVGLADSMDDDIWLGEGNQITMILDEGWSLGPGSKIQFFNNSESLNPAFVNGGLFAVDGDLDLTSTGLNVVFTADATLNAAMLAELGPESSLRFVGTTTLNGGIFVLDEDASLQFNSDTVVNAGTLITASTIDADGAVRFNGATEWDGSLTISGFATQNEDASVVGPTVINADVFDLDGDFGLADWTVGNHLTVNAGAIDESNNFYDGVLDITGTLLGKITMNLTDPKAQWGTTGIFNLGGVAAIMTTRIEGSKLVVEGGTLNISNRVQITADTDLISSTDVNFASPTARLRFAGETHVGNIVNFTGGGTLENGPSGDMTLDGAELDNSCSLLNAGTLRTEPPTGITYIDNNFTLEPTSTWEVKVSGKGFFDHDEFWAYGDAVQVAGDLDVRLIDLGGEFFAPSVGEEYVILRAPETALTGAFANQPVSFIPGWVYVWSILYFVEEDDSAVAIKVADIIPCPADLNGDGQVDGADLGLLLAAWGPCASCIEDINVDGQVDGADLGLLLAAWGACPLE
jgi:hypothetical protein